MKFYVGLYMPGQAKHFERCCISVNRLRERKQRVPSDEWMMDSGAFTELSQHGYYRHTAEEYAADVNRIAAGTVTGRSNCGLVAAVSQDWMCEPFIIEKTGFTVQLHQEMTIERYDAIRNRCKVYVMPVLQGYEPADYVWHIELYGERLIPNMWVGVGSVCKRNTSVAEVEDILAAIKARRPDLCLHGFGLKTTALGSSLVRDRLYSADSMAWSFSAWKEGRDANDWNEAKAFIKRIETMPVQIGMQF
jgi:hypothetical protein